jgi:hypothetical protein
VPPRLEPVLGDPGRQSQREYDKGEHGRGHGRHAGRLLFERRPCAQPRPADAEACLLRQHQQDEDKDRKHPGTGLADLAQQ